MRRFTILAAVVIILVSLAIGVYVLEVATGPSASDAFIGKPVSASEQSVLYHASLQPYGAAPTAAMEGLVQANGASVLTANGKPVIVYIGADFCPYCAIQRWALIMALNRFGNFTGLTYMTSRAGDVGAGDYPTFTFTGSSYSSSYVSFQPFEIEDRGGNTIATVPANYSATWNSNFPFMNFANSYTIPGSTLASPQDLTGKNWTQVLTSITTNTGVGVEIRESANLITSIICKLTGGHPAAVCTASPIPSVSSGLASPYSISLGTPDVALVTAPLGPVPGWRGLGRLE